MYIIHIYSYIRLNVSFTIMLTLVYYIISGYLPDNTIVYSNTTIITYYMVFCTTNTPKVLINYYGLNI